MKSLVLSLVVLCTAACCAGSLHADVVVLKSGEKIEGTVIEKNDTYLKLDYKGAVIVYRIYEVESVDGKPAASVKDTFTDKVLELSVRTAASSAGISDQTAVPPDEYIRRGIAYQSRGNFDQSISELNKAIKADPANVEAYLRRGLAFMSKHEADPAIADYDKAIELSPKNEQAYYVRGLAYAEKRDRKKAMIDYGRAIELNPEYVQAYLSRALLSMASGDTISVFADVNKAIKINQQVPMAYYVRGMAYANINEMAQAIDDYSKAIALNPNYAEAYINRALAHAFRGKIERAKADPNSPAAFINTAGASLDKDDYEKAIADSTRAIALVPQYAEAYLVRARIYLLGRDFDKAWVDVHKAEELGATVRPEFLEELRKESGRAK